MNKKMAIALFLFCLFSLSALAAMPKTLNYQGKLLDFTTKVPITTAIKTTFLIYDDATTGSPLWQEEQVITPDANGVFSAVLGNTTPVNVDLSKQLWLSVQAPTGIPNALFPRKQLTATPYALYAVTAESVVNNTPAGGWVDDGSVVRLITSTDKVSIEGNTAFNGKVGIGTLEPGANLDVKGIVKVFGNFQTKYSGSLTSSILISTETAATDGFLIGYFKHAGGYNGSFEATVDGVTYQRGYCTGSVPSPCLTMPVPKGKTWQVQWLAYSGSGTFPMAYIYWVPLGHN